MATLEQYKRQAAKIADSIEACKDLQNPAAYQHMAILHNKHTKGFKAALLCGLVVGALCERGLNDAAAQILADIAQLIDEGKG